jgi:hypothetical protein
MSGILMFAAGMFTGAAIVVIGLVYVGYKQGFIKPRKP